MEDLRVYTGQVLKAIRVIKGVSGPEIQQKLGISTNSLYDYEKGRSFPKALKAEQLFNLLRIDQNIFRKNIANSEIITGNAQTKIIINDGTSTPISGSSGLRYKRTDPMELAQKIIQESSFPNEIKIRNSDAELATDISGKWLPVISEAAAAECNPGLMPLLDCVNQYSEEQAFFSEGKENDFAIRVMGESMMPWYPPGTLLLVRPYQEIPNGKRVVAVLDEGEIIFKIFAKTADNKIALMSINENGKDYVFPPSGKGLRYICRVIQSIRNEDDLDDAMRQSGIHHSWETKLKNL